MPSPSGVRQGRTFSMRNINPSVSIGGGKMRIKILFMVRCALLFVATVQGQSNNAELRGNYAFGFSGVSGNTSVSSVYAAGGRFTGGRAGNLANVLVGTHNLGGSASRGQGF